MNTIIILCDPHLHVRGKVISHVKQTINIINKKIIIIIITIMFNYACIVVVCYLRLCIKEEGSGDVRKQPLV